MTIIYSLYVIYLLHVYYAERNLETNIQVSLEIIGIMTTGNIAVMVAALSVSFVQIHCSSH